MSFILIGILLLKLHPCSQNIFLERIRRRTLRLNIQFYVNMMQTLLCNLYEFILFINNYVCACSEMAMRSCIH